MWPYLKFSSLRHMWPYLIFSPSDICDHI
jgi:hypothetical protein